jgi:hypothetical protein
LHIPDGKPDKWDAYDAIEDGLDVWSFVKNAERTVVKDETPIPMHSLEEKVHRLPCVLTMTTENHFYRPLERHQIRSFHQALKLSEQLNRPA